MGLSHYVVVVIIIIISGRVLYHLGYGKGAKRVLKDWKEFNSEHFWGGDRDG